MLGFVAVILPKQNAKDVIGSVGCIIVVILFSAPLMTIKEVLRFLL